MRVFVTGATGYIGSAVVRELIDSGHTVVGLARSDRSAEWLQKLGAEAYRGDIDNVTSLQQGVAQADGVIHLAFKHDFADFEGSLATDLQVMESIGAVLEGSDKPFITTAHFNGVASEQVALSLAQRGVRTSIIELCPSVHGEGDTGFIPKLIAIAKEKGVAAYIEEGMNRWPAVHRLDAAHLYCLALEKAKPGSRLDGVADEGIVFRDIATVIGKHLNVPVVSIPQDQAQDHFGFLGALAALDIPRSSQSTKQQLGWQPVHPSLLEDLEQGHYFR
ncbi:SDR family oxidoreductase [Paenibacillus sp. KACC 21273]|uniref:SDR family oxidoreductase n=1 Tax=Paenibacillus sp. KACC 21273 TaxID=3025665 RepID=UPI002365BD04|nr:SDR family oxidoreductase [Paenibacillus sp. KACC 21273]WDF51348.1 SDR family oxidoreductase [Paenibacillus sp. KACC 21273]